MNIEESWFDFTKYSLPDWECPTCKRGILNFHKEYFVESEVAASREYRKVYSHHDDWLECSFSAKLTCSDNRCNEVVTMVGEGRVDWDIVPDKFGHPSKEKENFFRPRYFEPHLEPISIPVKCPERARKALREAFKVMFISFELACNQLRVAIEYIVDGLPDRNGEMLERKDGDRPSLDKRIGKINDNLKSSKEFLLAVKWVGNAGSHEIDALNFHDFVDALCLVERVLNDLYSDVGLECHEAVALHINEHKKPRSQIKKM